MNENFKAKKIHIIKVEQPPKIQEPVKFNCKEENCCIFVVEWRNKQTFKLLKRKTLKFQDILILYNKR